MGKAEILFFSVRREGVLFLNLTHIILLPKYRSLLKTHQIPEFIYHESLNADEVELCLHQGEELGSSWQKLFVRVSITFCFVECFYFLVLMD